MWWIGDLIKNTDITLKGLLNENELTRDRGNYEVGKNFVLVCK